MKRIILLLTLSFVFLTSVNAQTKFEPYVGAGVSISHGEFSRGGELGIYNSKSWVALTYQNAEGEHYAGVKTYYKVNTAKQPSFVDSYLSLGTSFHIAQDKTFTIEPGAAVVFNISNRVAPQLSLGFPLTDKLRKGLATFGAGLNLWLY